MNPSAVIKAKICCTILIAAIGLSCGSASAQSPPEATAANEQAKRLFREGKLLEAVPYARRFADLTNTNRPEDKWPHEIALANIEVLADEMVKQGVTLAKGEQYTKAIPLLEGAQRLYGELPGAEAEPKRQALKQNLSPIYRRTEDIYFAYAKRTRELVQGYKHEEAEQNAKRAIEFARALYNYAPNLLGDALTDAAQIHISRGRYSQALPLFKEAVERFEEIFGMGDDPSKYFPVNRGFLAGRHDRLAEIYFALDEFGAAEQHYKRALLLRQAVSNPTKTDLYAVGYSLNRLGLLYSAEGRWSDAESLFERAFEISSSLGKDREADVADVLNNLGLVYDGERRHEAAQEKFLKALEIDERIYGPEHREVATILINLGESLTQTASKEALLQAETHLRRALAIMEKTDGHESAAASFSMHNLAYCLQKQGKLSEAESYFKRSLAIRQKIMEPDQSNVAASLEAVAWLAAQKGNWREAYPQFAEAANIRVGHSTREARSSRPMADPVARSQLDEARASIIAMILAGDHIARDEAQRTNEIDEDTFKIAQFLEGSAAATAIVRMAARYGTANPGLSRLVRERQDQVIDWQIADKDLTAVIAASSTARKDEQVATARMRRQQIESRLDAIDAQIEKEFPQYASYANPAPLGIPEVQPLLSANEVLIKFIDVPEIDLAPESTIVWAVTKTDSKRVRITVGPRAIAEHVKALRCGLDYDGAWSVLGSRCPDLLNIEYTRADNDAHRPLPFDVVRAHELYKALFGQVEDLIKDQQILIVPSGALTQLPFQVLVTEQPRATMPASAAGYRDVAWLARKHPIVVLPAVSSLKALREFAKASRPTEPFIGFGNPLLDGDPKQFKDDSAAASRARDKQTCTPAMRQRLASLFGLRGGARALVTGEDNLAELDEVRRQLPLPETADELCEVAQSLGGDPGKHVYLGAKATETQVKQLSSDGSLARYKIVQFATHGAVAGDISRTSEPGLILTPPEKATEVDDGYLSASEVATLNLDADWVILSACNTAAGNANGAEALSGLARAFFYAGARSLLASHWAVYSGATAKLITKAVSEMKADPKIGRAQALRRSILALIDKGEGLEAHPAFWAPFVLVGEGAARSDATSAK